MATQQNDNDGALENLVLYMDDVATSAKKKEPLGLLYVEVGAVKIMPDGVAIYHMDKFIKVKQYLTTLLQEEYEREAEWHGSGSQI